MLKVNCNHCGQELEAEGGVVVSPPETVLLGSVHMEAKKWTKLHICPNCWPHFEEWLLCPQGNVDNMVSVCHEVIRHDEEDVVGPGVGKHWNLIVEKARAILTYKGGSLRKP